MKKTIIIMLLLLTFGCEKEEKLTCTYKNEKAGNKYTSVMDITIKKDIVKNATVTMTYEDKKLAELMCENFKMAEDARGNLKCTDNSIILKNYHKSVSKEPMSKKDYLDYINKKEYICK